MNDREYNYVENSWWQYKLAEYEGHYAIEEKENSIFDKKDLTSYKKSIILHTTFNKEEKDAKTNK